MEKKYFIYCKKGLDEYIDKLEELGFFYEKKIEYSVLDYEIGKFRYRGDNFNQDSKCLKSIDDTIRIEEIPIVKILKK